MKSLDEMSETELLGRNADMIIKESLIGKRFRYIGLVQGYLPKEDIYSLTLKISGINSSLIIRNESKEQELPTGFSLDCLELFREIKSR